MKRILIILLTMLTLSGVVYDGNGVKGHVDAKEMNKKQYSDSTPTSPVINAEGAVIIEQESSKILFQKNGNKRMYPASTTKILTALIAIENGDLNETITIGDEIKLMDPDGSRAWLRVGEKMKLSTLIMGLMLPSGNDAAYTIALSVGRKIANNPSLKREEAINIFIDKMNERAREIGAKDSNFVNPHGIHNNEHYTTPYDLALITREAFKYDFFKQAVKTQEYEVLNTDSQGHIWENTNKLLDKGSNSYYKYATGVKTGHTTPAGYCLVSSGNKDNMDVITVVLNTTQGGQFEDSRKLLDYGLNSFTHYEVIKKGDILQSLMVINKLPWDDMDLDIISSEDFEDVFNRSDIPNIKWEVKWNSELIEPSEDGAEGIKILSSLKKGQVLGKAIYTLNGETLGELDIESGRDIKKKYAIFYLPGTMFIYENRYVTVPVGMLLIVGLSLKKLKHVKKKKRIKR